MKMFQKKILEFLKNAFMKRNPLTAQQTGSEVLLIHFIQEVHCEFQKCFPSAPLLLVLIWTF